MCANHIFLFMHIFFEKYLSGTSLKARFIRSSAWLAIGNIAEKIIAFISKVMLARLLMPEELGLIVLILSINGLFECLSEIGIKQCVIQNKMGENEDFLNMAWWIQVIRGIVIFSTAWVLTPLVCKYYFHNRDNILSIYHWNELYLMVRITFISVILKSLTSPKAYILEKNFNFKIVVAYMQSSALIGALVTIVLTLLLRNTWALVIGFICKLFLQMTLSYAFCPFLPRFTYNHICFTTIFNFAKRLLGAPIFSYIAYTSDILIGGKIVGPEQIGLYGFAISLAYLPRELFSQIISPVLMPAFSEHQNNPHKIKVIITKFTSNSLTFASLSIPCLFIFHKYILTTVYGKNFENTSIILPIGNITVLFIIINIILGNLFTAFGKPEIFRNSTFARTFVLLIIIIPASKEFGIIGIALSQSIANAIMCSMFFIYAHKLIQIKLSDLFNPKYNILIITISKLISLGTKRIIRKTHFSSEKDL